MTKMLLFFSVCASLLILPALNYAQSNFSIEKYSQFLQSNKNMTSKQLLINYAPQNAYYKSGADSFSVEKYVYLDTIISKYKLTDAELGLLAQNQFVVSERLKFNNFGRALDDIYFKDLPIFISTDAILHALHCSYDQILVSMEAYTLIPNLQKILKGLSDAFVKSVSRYDSIASLTHVLNDVDLYITIAKSLINGAKGLPQYADSESVNEIWNAIQAEQPLDLPLFSQNLRSTDFSQFTVRGHYTLSPPLGNYFKCMIWLSFAADFRLTLPSPSQLLDKNDIRRMNLDAAFINELLDSAQVRDLLSQNDKIIAFMVGESDNLTPDQFSEILGSLGINRVDMLLDDSKYEALQKALATPSVTNQQILSNIFYSDPYSPDQIALPISFRLLGQRFIVDSYIFSNVVYDRIIYNNQKVLRLMPDPLDILFVLGNDNVPQLLKNQLDTYKYAYQLSALRYLVEAYDPQFWKQSLYNTWLQALRQLNPPTDMIKYPFFMKTVAWQQEKINTQLASWTQLRHDNLLYAKQSFSGSTTCSYPYGFVEPYPYFYHQIGILADRAGDYFSRYSSGGDVAGYFGRLKDCMSQLEGISQKELEQIPFSENEIKFLQSMLYVPSDYGVCKVAGRSETPALLLGWYPKLFYNFSGTQTDLFENNYVVVDVHTQPSDSMGDFVGKILHVGVGKINLGIFLTGAPSADYEPMAFVGPVMSYYEKITQNFQRLTDEIWTGDVFANQVPDRPDWVNIYLADGAGKAFKPGRELAPGIFTSVAAGQHESVPSQFSLFQNYPNPFNPTTIIKYELPKATQATLKIYNILGQQVKTVVSDQLSAGVHEFQWDGTDDSGNKVASGIYIYRLETKSGYTQSKKMVYLK